MRRLFCACSGILGGLCKALLPQAERTPVSGMGEDDTWNGGEMLQSKEVDAKFTGDFFDNLNSGLACASPCLRCVWPKLRFAFRT